MLVGEDALQLRDLQMQGVQFILDLLAFQAGKLAEAHLHDGGRLHVVEGKPLHQPLLGHRNVGGGADDVDHLVDEVHRRFERFPDMGALLGLAQLKHGATGDDLHLEFDVFLQHLLEGQNTGHPIHQRQHNDAEGGLHLGKGKELVEHHLRIGVFFQIDDNPHTLAAGMIHHIVDPLDPLVVSQLDDGFDQIELIDLIGDLADDDAEPVVVFFDLGAGAHNDPSPAGRIGRTDAGMSHNDAARGEIGPLDAFHDVRELRIRPVDEQADRVHHFAEVLRRDVGRHADGDAGRAVHQQIRKTGGQHNGFLETIVVVVGEIHRFLVDVRQHVQRHLAHARFGIPVGGGGMAVDGTEVAVPVDQRIPQGEILRHAHHGVVYRGVAVRMIPAQHGAHRVGALAVCLIGGQVVLVHGVEDPAVHRLEPVPHIRQGAGNDDRHGVFEEAFLHLLLQIHRYHFHLRRLFFHCVTIPFRVALRLQIPARGDGGKTRRF